MLLEQKAHGDDSELHIIIFDEIDAICKQRGSTRDGTGVGDSIVNQVNERVAVAAAPTTGCQRFPVACDS